MKTFIGSIVLNGQYTAFKEADIISNPVKSAFSYSEAHLNVREISYEDSLRLEINEIFELILISVAVFKIQADFMVTSITEPYEGKVNATFAIAGVPTLYPIN